MAVLSPGFPTSERPAHRPAIIDTLEAVAERHDLEVHALRPPPVRAGRAVYRGLTVVGYGAGSKASRFARLARDLVGAAVAERLARHGFPSFDGAPPDVLWALWADRTGPAAVLLGAALRRPVVLSIMGGEVAALPELDYGYARTPARRALLRLMLDRATRVTVGSERLAESVAAFAPLTSAKLRVAPLGARGVPSLHVVPSAGGVLRLAALSDLSPVKRPELLVETLDALQRRGVAATLDVFGELRGRGDELRGLARALGVDLTLHGFVPHEEVMRGLVAHACLLHASAHESQGSALVEGALLGLPIATTDVGVAPELRLLGAVVELAPPDPAELAQAVLRALQRAPAEDARARVAAHFGLEAAAARFVRVLEEAAS